MHTDEFVSIPKQMYTKEHPHLMSLNYSATKILTTQPSRYHFSKETSYQQLPLFCNRIQSNKLTLQLMIEVQ